MDKNSPTWRKLQEFANEHKLILEDKGEVGFGRPCVGFIKGTGYIDYDPLDRPDYLTKVFPNDKDLDPPQGVPNAYHKHSCMAVLVHGDDYDAALEELAVWVDDLNRIGVRVVDFPTGAYGIQALISGVTGYAFRRIADIEAAMENVAQEEA